MFKHRFLHMKKILLTTISTLFSLSLIAQSQTWLTVPGGIPAGVHHPVTFAIGDYGYSITGVNSNGSTIDKVYRYNPVTDSWATLPDFPGGSRGFAIGLTYQGKGYVGFGVSSSQYFDDLWAYDTATMQWTQLADCPGPARRHPALMAANGKIYVGLGNDNTGDLKDFWQYDIASDSWTQLPDIPGPARHHPFMFAVNGEVYAGMGHGGNFIFDDWYRFDTVNNTWQTMTDFPGEARVAGTQFDHMGHGYVLSGDGDNHSFMSTGEFWEYDDATDNWTQLASHPGPSRWAPGSFVINDTLYFFGGLNRFSSVHPTDMYKYAFNSAGIGLKESNISAAIYPNPSKGLLTIKSKETWSHAFVYASDGQKILEVPVSEKQVDLRALPAGMYLIELSGTKGNSELQRVLIN